MRACSWHLRRLGKARLPAASRSWCGRWGWRSGGEEGTVSQGPRRATPSGAAAAGWWSQPWVWPQGGRVLQSSPAPPLCNGEPRVGVSRTPRGETFLRVQGKFPFLFFFLIFDSPRPPAHPKEPLPMLPVSRAVWPYLALRRTPDTLQSFLQFSPRAPQALLHPCVCVGVGRGRNGQSSPAWWLPGSRVKANRSVPGLEIGGKLSLPWPQPGSALKMLCLLRAD